MAGSESFGLLHALYICIIGKNRTDFIGAVANDDDDAVDASLSSGINGPPNKWLA